MFHPESSLPDAWIEKIWSVMRATYGAAFDRQWECPEGIEPALHVQGMKAHWRRELRGFLQNPDAIAHALDHLPPHPPNLVQFRALCINRPEPAAKLLPAPKASNAVVAAVLGAMKPKHDIDPKAWAHELRDREKRGDRLTRAQRDMWRAAIGAQVEATGEVA